MKQYIDIAKEILKYGEFTENRTKVRTKVLPGFMFKHDMSEGFPALTTKYVPLHLVAIELEFFIKGITDKEWLQKRRCKIWNQWCSPDIVPYGHDEETKAAMAKERDLGPLYGFQWRYFNGGYKGYNRIPKPAGIDQLKNLIHTLKTDPSNRRMLVMAWNPNQIDQMALPPCHYCFQVTVNNGKLNLLWNQRSVDVCLGLPFNIACYGLLLLLFCLETGYKPGKLIGFLADTHIYETHIPVIEKQIEREPQPLPTLEIIPNNFGLPGSPFDLLSWESEEYLLTSYHHHSNLPYEIVV